MLSRIQPSTEAQAAVGGAIDARIAAARDVGEGVAPEQQAGVHARVESVGRRPTGNLAIVGLAGISQVGSHSHRAKEAAQQRAGMALIEAPDAGGATHVIDAPAVEAIDLVHLSGGQAGHANPVADGMADSTVASGQLQVPEAGADGAAVFAKQTADLIISAHMAVCVGVLDGAPVLACQSADEIGAGIDRGARVGVTNEAGAIVVADQSAHAVPAADNAVGVYPLQGAAVMTNQTAAIVPGCVQRGAGIGVGDVAQVVAD